MNNSMTRTSYKLQLSLVKTDGIGLNISGELTLLIIRSVVLDLFILLYNHINVI